mmetsp:Transcript_10005/g.17547  ORF Transcript_10005/g.17547 Transcript_10005/m.17547 type:complete len:464 (-) Transcript_10005:80-1471(-)
MGDFTLDTVLSALDLSSEAANVCKTFQAEPVKNGSTIEIGSLCNKYIREHTLDDTFYIVDFGNLSRLHNAWRSAMPRVTPFFAIKACPQPAILAFLAAHGCGFDCASAEEIKLVQQVGAPMEKVIYAHPAKAPRDIRFAAEQNVSMTTFDSVTELEKILKWHPTAELVLRIRADDPDAQIPFGIKFGAEENEYELLLGTAKELGLKVIGVSFHVGSLARNSSAYEFAIVQARKVFDIAAELGHEMHLLDIGGGFVGRFDAEGNVTSMTGEIPHTINRTLEEHFGPESPFPNTQVIAEPGRYFCEGTMHLVCVIHSHRRRKDAEGKSWSDYVLSDGLYGSFNGVIYDGSRPSAFVLPNPLTEEDAAQKAAPDCELERSIIFGPTCDSMDCVYKDVMLPLLSHGDWLAFPHYGAYSWAGACDFNGMMASKPRLFHIVSESNVENKDSSASLYSCAMTQKPSPIVA